MYFLAKDLIDRLLALCLLLLCLPVMLAIAAMLQLSGLPVFFTQARIGYKGRIFRLYKFCTMRNAYDANGQILPDAQRLTRVGKLLRKTSLDELPQFWNILRGDMSFVGPRPLLPEYLPLYSERQARRHSVRQGLTGWAQVQGRNALDWQTRLELDAQYAERASFWFDVRILAKTAFLLLLKRDGDILVEKFTGNPPT